jgi:DNA-binding transcriptional LysR family regulator
VLEHPPNELVRATVEAGASVIVISKPVAANSLKAGLLVVVAVDLPERLFFALRHKERYVAQAERELLSLVVKGVDTGKVGEVSHTQYY